MNYRSILIVCLATLGLAVAGWGQVVTSSDGEAWVAGDIRRLTDASSRDRYPSWSPDGRHIAFEFYKSCVWCRKSIAFSIGIGDTIWLDAGRRVSFVVSGWAIYRVYFLPR